MTFPHRVCLVGDPLTLWVTFIADLLIMLAYFGIPIGLMYLYAVRPRTVMWQYSIRTNLLVLFSAFIFACGTSHLFDAITMFVPWYKPAAAVKLFTAFISLTTLAVMIKRRRAMLSFPTKIEKLHRELDELHVRIAQSRPSP